MHNLVLNLYLRFVSGGYLDGLADLAPSGKFPRIREIFTLLRFHRLDGAFIPLQEKAGSIRSVNQGKPSPVGMEACVLLDEGALLHAHMRGNREDLFLRHADKAWPAAAGRTALAEIGGRHRGKRRLAF